MKNTNSICWRHKTATSFSHLVAEIVFVFLIVYLTGSSSAKVPIWAYYCMNSCVQPEQDPPVYYSIVILTILYYLRVADLMGITSPYPRENIIASNYILADTQAFLSKRHRQQNNEILIRHSPGIGGCFFAFKYSINRKNKKIFLRGL